MGLYKAVACNSGSFTLASTTSTYPIGHNVNGTWNVMSRNSLGYGSYSLRGVAVTAYSTATPVIQAQAFVFNSSDPMGYDLIASIGGSGFDAFRHDIPSAVGEVSVASIPGGPTAAALAADIYPDRVHSLIEDCARETISSIGGLFRARMRSINGRMYSMEFFVYYLFDGSAEPSAGKHAWHSIFRRSEWRRRQ